MRCNYLQMKKHFYINILIQHIFKHSHFTNRVLQGKNTEVIRQVF